MNFVSFLDDSNDRDNNYAAPNLRAGPPIKPRMSVRGDMFADMKLAHDLRSSKQAWDAVTEATMSNREKWAASVEAGHFYQLMPLTGSADEVRLVLVEQIFVPHRANVSRSATGSGVIQAILLRIRNCSARADPPILGCRSYEITNTVASVQITDIMRPVHMLHFCGEPNGSACLAVPVPGRTLLGSIGPKFFKAAKGFHSRDVGSVYLHNQYYIK